MLRKHIYSGKIIELIVDQIEIQGEECLREVVRHPGGVVILAEFPDGSIPFVRQLRYPMQRQLLELPAGKLDGGEEPEAAAGRELEEETGLRPRQLEHVFSFYSTPGFCDEELIFFRVSELGPPDPHSRRKPDADEDIHAQVFTIDEAKMMVTRGDIIDLKTAYGLTLI